MKNKYSIKNKVFIVIIVLCVSFLYFINTRDYIKSFYWKLNSTNRISDFLEFDGLLEIRNRKILVSDQEYGTIILCLHKYLIVTNNNGDLCLYVNKGEINRD